MEMTKVEEMFVEMLDEMGYESWWASEDAWDEMEERMVEAGLDASEVREFFAEMEEEL